MGKDFGIWAIVVTAVINTSIVVAYHIIEEQVKCIIVVAISTNSKQLAVHTSTPRAFTHTMGGIDSRNSTKPVLEGGRGTFVAFSPP